MDHSTYWTLQVRKDLHKIATVIKINIEVGLIETWQIKFGLDLQIMPILNSQVVLCVCHNWTSISNKGC